MEPAAPRVSYTGPVAIWWIPRPRGPRISLAWAVLAWTISIPVVAGTLLWLRAESQPLWPFGRQIVGSSGILLRYEIVLLVCLAYVTLRSVPRWVGHVRLVRRDAGAINEAIRSEHWEHAGLLLHRYCLLYSAIRKRMPASVATWDAVIRPKLPRHRRLYVYYRKAPPPLPPDATASFVPAIIPPPRPSLWSAAALLPIAFLLYLLILDILRNQYWQRIVLFNALLLMVILLSYGTYFLLTLLGRSRYFRFAPGVVELVSFGPGRDRPRIETFDLRQVHAALDLSSGWPALTLLDTPGYKRETFGLPKGTEAIEAVFRAALSTAARPPLSQEQLVD